MKFKYKEVFEHYLSYIDSEEKYYKELIKVCISLKGYKETINIKKIIYLNIKNMLGIKFI